MVSACNLCGSGKAEPAEEYEADGERFHLVRCASCGLLYVQDPPDPGDMDRFYEDFPHGTESPSAARTAAFSVLRWLIANRYGDGGERGARLSRAAEPLWSPLVRTLRRRYHVATAPPLGDILDVGCARGVWMAAQRRLGFHCVGCEPDDRAARDARALGFDVVTGDLFAAAYPADAFDLVHFGHVLEHTHDPLAVLREAARVVRPGGAVAVVVPNADGLFLSAFRGKEDVPRHLYSFAARHLRRYLEAAGLTVVEVRTESPYPESLFAPFADASRRALELDGADPRLADAFWRSPATGRAGREIARFADRTGAGAYLVAVGERPRE